MLRYILIRVLYFIPTLLGISLVVFFLSKNTPGDPVDKFMDEDLDTFESFESRQKRRAAIVKDLKLDRPNFYFGIKKDRNGTYPILPKLQWHGLNNQYHNWFFGFLKGNFGNSYFDRQPVTDRIWSSLKWTLLINLVSIFLAYAIAIPLGVFSAGKEGSMFDKITGLILYALYAVPAFWIATLLITFLASTDWLYWFPAGGVGNLDNGFSNWQIFKNTVWHLTLPIFCVTYIALTFITRQVRASMIDVLSQDYIKTAYVKGLNKNEVLWKHGFRNSLFPLLTMFANILPATIGGSVIIEIIFSIPGMGRLAYDGLLQQDWPMVFTITMLGALLSLIGNLIADISYTIADPRVSFSKQSK